MTSARSCGRSGSSMGCVVNQMLQQDVLQQQQLQVRNLLAEALPLRVQAPAERRHPGEAALDQHDAQVGEALEHTLHHQARYQGLHGLHVGVVLLHVVGGPAAAGGGMPALAADVDGDGRLAATAAAKIGQ